METLDNGLAMGDGWTNIQVDDYGAYGFAFSQSEDDEYRPPGAATSQTPTFLGGVMMFVTTPGATTGVVLTDDAEWARLTEGGGVNDGIAGDHVGLTRLVTLPNQVVAQNELESSFLLRHTQTQLSLAFELQQKLTSSSDTSLFDQIYTITNNGQIDVDIVFHVVWEADLYYAANDATDDIVGTMPGRCYVYMRDPGTMPHFAVALGDGPMSTQPFTYYYAGKQNYMPGTGPAYEPINGTAQVIWNSRGLPPAWQNNIAGIGYNQSGEDQTRIGDATLGLEYRFTIPQGAVRRVHVQRHYGTFQLTCANPNLPECGNGVVETGEMCDGADTSTCNGATCTQAACGDGYFNAVAEPCESGGQDLADCNIDCSLAECGDGYVNAAANESCDDEGETAACNIDCTPAMCGDGHVNAAAGEECETGELCDMPTCTVAFTLGGGCAGCGAGGDAGGGLLLFAIVAACRRRRTTTR